MTPRKVNWITAAILVLIATAITLTVLKNRQSGKPSLTVPGVSASAANIGLQRISNGQLQAHNHHPARSMTA